MKREKTSLRWYRIIAESDDNQLPFSRFYKEHYGEPDSRRQ